MTEGNRTSPYHEPISFTGRIGKEFSRMDADPEKAFEAVKKLDEQISDDSREHLGLADEVKQMIEEEQGGENNG